MFKLKKMQFGVTKHILLKLNTIEIDLLKSKATKKFLTMSQEQQKSFEVNDWAAWA